jgi:hypothetical protein
MRCDVGCDYVASAGYQSHEEHDAADGTCGRAGLMEIRRRMKHSAAAVERMSQCQGWL